MLILACTIFGLWRKISAGKSCIITSWRSSHVFQIKLWLLLLKELKIQYVFKYALKRKKKQVIISLGKSLQEIDNHNTEEAKNNF